MDNRKRESQEEQFISGQLLSSNNVTMSPITPPDTPKGNTPGAGDNNQGDVNNAGIQNDRGVVTGNVHGYNIIAGTPSYSLGFLSQ